MAFPGPTERQARILWMAVTAFAIGVLLAMVGLLVLGVGWVLQRLSSVLLPLAVAGIIAYLLDPIVDLLQRRRMPRAAAIWSVFLLGLLLVAIISATLIPRLIVETRELAEQVRSGEFTTKVEKRVQEWFETSPWGRRAQAVWASDFGEQLQGWMTDVAPVVYGWLLAQLKNVASWMGLLIGFALVPVYTFYFLLEKTGIERKWTDYLPVHQSWAKDEVVFVLRAINDYLILFFRGQVLVAMCDGILLTIGFLAMGLNYAFLLGMVAGVLTIVPFLGVVISLIPALILAAVQFNSWLQPLIVLGIFGLVQLLEGLVISPKIMGDRVGLHPLTIIVAVMVGTTLMGGIIGGILAIPLTAALRVVMFRYIWHQPAEPMTREEKAERRRSKDLKSQI